VESVEPTLEQYKPAIVSSMIFTRTDLGSNSPEIRGYTTAQKGFEGPRRKEEG